MNPQDSGLWCGLLLKWLIDADTKGRIFPGLNDFMRVSLIFALVIGCVLTAVCYLFTNQIVSLFLSDQESFGYAVNFARILLSTSFIFGVFYVLTNAIQAMGAATPALIINLSRQGLIYIPALFIMRSVLGVYGLMWAQPVADVISTVMAALLYAQSFRKMSLSWKAFLQTA